MSAQHRPLLGFPLQRRRLLTTGFALAAFALVSGGGPAAAAEPTTPAVDLTPLAPLLFCDRDLADIVAFSAASGSGDRPPWSLFRRALDARTRGDEGSAREALLKVLDTPAAGTPAALWAWSNLRRLGVSAPAGSADRVQGVVFEVPTGDGTDTLAVYADGRWRLVRRSGGGVFWERTTDPASRQITDDIIAAAQRGVFWFPEVAERGTRPPGSIRIALLTFAGLRQETVSTPMLETGPQFRVLAEGFDRLLAFADAVSGERR